MPKPRKSLAGLELSGQLAKNPGRYAGRQDRALNPVKHGDLGEPHYSLSDDEKCIWIELAADAPIGALQRSDRMIVEICSRLIAKVRDGRARSTEMAILSASLAKIGFSPADREKITIPHPVDAEDDPIAVFVAGTQRRNGR